MSNTWFAAANRRPGPAWKTSYPGVAIRSLSEIEGEVKHSAEGSLAGSLAVLDSDAYSSWTFTLAKDGRTFQHYPLEVITWHAGLPGDRRADTSLVGNLTLVGIEHEGVVGEALTAAQVEATIALSRFLRQNCVLVGARPPSLRKNLWEHRWLTATSCPSGRIPWNAIIAALKKEDGMASLRFITVADPDVGVYVTDEMWKRGVSGSFKDWLVNTRRVERHEVATLSQEDFGAIKTTHDHSGGDGGPHPHTVTLTGVTDEAG